MDFHFPIYLSNEAVALKEKAFEYSVNKSRPVEELHVFPRRFIYSREGGYPSSFTEPLVEKMQKSATEHRYGKTE